jgi:threonine dehydratase
MLRTDLPVGLDQVMAARGHLRGQCIETPTPRTRAFEDLVQGNLYFKMEGLQKTGSFKDRGSLNRLLHLTEEERARGVVTASAGNHGQALSYHSSRLGIPCTVVMPVGAPLIKVTSTRNYGAQVIQYGEVLDDSAEEAHRLVREEGRVMIPAFDDPHVIAGQGTMGLEILEQVPEVDVVVVPVGGGGMISGIAVAMKALRPSVRIIGVEVDAAPSARASRDAGHIVKIAASQTIADGIATKRVGDHTFPIMQALVDDLVVVTEEETAQSILLLLERQKAVVEGGGAVALAALTTGRVPVKPSETVVAVLSGGNIDVNRLARIINRGLVFDGRLIRFKVKVPDRPGSLEKLTRLVAALGANVKDIRHRRAFADISVGDVEIILSLETRGPDHTAEVEQALRDEGLEVRIYD